MYSSHNGISIRNRIDQRFRQRQRYHCRKRSTQLRRRTIGARRTKINNTSSTKIAVYASLTKGDEKYNSSSEWQNTSNRIAFKEFESDTESKSQDKIISDYSRCTSNKESGNGEYEDRYRREYEGAYKWRDVLARLYESTVFINTDECSTSNFRELSVSSVKSLSTAGKDTASSSSSGDCRRMEFMEEESQFSDMKSTTIFVKYILERIPAYQVMHQIIPIKNGIDFGRLPSGTEDNATSIKRVLDTDQYRSTKPRAILISRHCDHYHVVHACPRSNGTCRCSWTDAIRLRYYRSRSTCRGRRVVKAIWFPARDEQHLRNLMEYLCRGSRRVCYVHVAPATWSQCNKIRSVRFHQVCECGKKQLVEGGDCSECGSNYGSQRSNPKTSRKAYEHDCYSFSEHEPRKENYSGPQKVTPHKVTPHNELLSFLTKHVVSPVSFLFHMRPWMDSKYVHYNHNLNYFKTTLERYYFIINQRSTLNCLDLYLQLPLNELYFNCGNEPINEYYYSVEKSVDILETLLLFQYKTVEAVKIFLSKLLCIVDKRIPKTNAMCIIASPNAGKNYFFDCVIHYFINFGQIGNFTKYNQFPLQEAVNRRILLWNEPYFEPGSEETLKCLFGGDTLNCKVKYMPDAIVNRTPIIILTNRDCIPHNNAFNARCFFEYWTTCHLLKVLKKKPHPLAFGLLLKHYDIFTHVNTICNNNEI